MFKPLIHECSIEQGDEIMAFWVREPSGREILLAANATKKDKPAIENAKELFAKYVVHENGSALSKEEVDELLDMRLSAMHSMSEIVQEKIGLKKVLEKNA